MKLTFRAKVTSLAGLTLTGLVFRTLLSYGLAPIRWRYPRPNTDRFSSQLAEAFSFLGTRAQEMIRGETIFALPKAYLLAYSLPIVLSSLAFIALLAVLAKHRDQLNEEAPRLLFRWCVVFALVCVPASPVMIQDFWLSLAWGRMASHGVNPYHADLRSEFVQGLPLDRPTSDTRMTYGPMWAAISAGIMLLVPENVLLAAFVFKLLLAGCWLGSLYLIWRLLSREPPWHQCLGIAIFGWLPLSPLQSIADGHNDVAMTLFLLLWLFALNQGFDRYALLSLAASATVKYVTAPLGLVDLIWHFAYKKGKFREYLASMFRALVLALITFGLFLRSLDFFDSMRRMRHWTFIRPVDAIREVGILMGLRLDLLGHLVQVGFVAFAIAMLVRFCRQPGKRSLYASALGIMAAILFAVVGHVWPWFLLWVLPLVALRPEMKMSRWIIGVALVTQFVVVERIIFPTPKAPLHSLFIYGFALAWLVIAPGPWFTAGLRPRSDAARQ